MAFPTEQTKDNLRLAWLSLLEALYTFSPWQRLLLVGGIIMIIPAYWIFRAGAQSYYSYSYKASIPEAHPSFTNPGAAQVGSVAILPVAGGGYVAYAKVSNPNLTLSGNGARYEAVFTGASGRQVYQTSGQFYLRPGKETYIVIPRFQSTEAPVSGKIEVADIHWQQKFTVPEVKLGTPAPIGFAEKEGTRFEGIVVNNSAYKLGAVHIVVFVYDASNKVIGVSDRSEFSVLPQERRAYVLHFPGVQPEAVAKIVPIAETNVSDPSNIQTPAGQVRFNDFRPKP